MEGLGGGGLVCVDLVHHALQGVRDDWGSIDLVCQGLQGVVGGWHVVVGMCGSLEGLCRVLQGNIHLVCVDLVHHCSLQGGDGRHVAVTGRCRQQRCGVLEVVGRSVVEELAAPAVAVVVAPTPAAKVAVCGVVAAITGVIHGHAVVVVSVGDQSGAPLVGGGGGVGTGGRQEGPLAAVVVVVVGGGGVGLRLDVSVVSGSLGGCGCCLLCVSQQFAAVVLVVVLIFVVVVVEATAVVVAALDSVDDCSDDAVCQLAPGGAAIVAVGAVVAGIGGGCVIHGHPVEVVTVGDQGSAPWALVVDWHPVKVVAVGHKGGCGGGHERVGERGRRKSREGKGRDSRGRERVSIMHHDVSTRPGSG